MMEVDHDIGPLVVAGCAGGDYADAAAGPVDRAAAFVVGLGVGVWLLAVGHDVAVFPGHAPQVGMEAL